MTNHLRLLIFSFWIGGPGSADTLTSPLGPPSLPSELGAGGSAGIGGRRNSAFRRQTEANSRVGAGMAAECGCVSYLRRDEVEV